MTTSQRRTRLVEEHGRSNQYGADAQNEHECRRTQTYGSAQGPCLSQFDRAGPDIGLTNVHRSKVKPLQWHLHPENGYKSATDDDIAATRALLQRRC